DRRAGCEATRVVAGEDRGVADAEKRGGDQDIVDGHVAAGDGAADLVGRAADGGLEAGQLPGGEAEDPDVEGLVAALLEGERTADVDEGADGEDDGLGGQADDRILVVDDERTAGAGGDGDAVGGAGGVGGLAPVDVSGGRRGVGEPEDLAGTV